MEMFIDVVVKVKFDEEKLAEKLKAGKKIKIFHQSLSGHDTLKVNVRKEAEHFLLKAQSLHLEASGIPHQEFRLRNVEDVIAKIKRIYGTGDIFL